MIGCEFVATYIDEDDFSRFGVRGKAVPSNNRESEAAVAASSRKPRANPARVMAITNEERQRLRMPVGTPGIVKAAIPATKVAGSRRPSRSPWRFPRHYHLRHRIWHPFARRKLVRSYPILAERGRRNPKEPPRVTYSRRERSGPRNETQFGPGSMLVNEHYRNQPCFMTPGYQLVDPTDPIYVPHYPYPQPDHVETSGEHFNRMLANAFANRYLPLSFKPYVLDTEAWKKQQIAKLHAMGYDHLEFLRRIRLPAGRVWDSELSPPSPVIGPWAHVPGSAKLANLDFSGAPIGSALWQMQQEETKKRAEMHKGHNEDLRQLREGSVPDIPVAAENNQASRAHSHIQEHQMDAQPRSERFIQNQTVLAPIAARTQREHSRGERRQRVEGAIQENSFTPPPGLGLVNQAVPKQQQAAAMPQTPPNTQPGQSAIEQVVGWTASTTGTTFDVSANHAPNPLHPGNELHLANPLHSGLDTYRQWQPEAANPLQSQNPLRVMLPRKASMLSAEAPEFSPSLKFPTAPGGYQRSDTSGRYYPPSASELDVQTAPMYVESPTLPVVVTPAVSATVKVPVSSAQDVTTPTPSPEQEISPVKQRPFRFPGEGLVVSTPPVPWPRVRSVTKATKNVSRYVSETIPVVGAASSPAAIVVPIPVAVEAVPVVVATPVLQKIDTTTEIGPTTTVSSVPASKTPLNPELMSRLAHAQDYGPLLANGQKLTVVIAGGCATTKGRRRRTSTIQETSHAKSAPKPLVLATDTVPQFAIVPARKATLKEPKVEEPDAVLDEVQAIEPAKNETEADVLNQQKVQGEKSAADLSSDQNDELAASLVSQISEEEPALAMPQPKLKKAGQLPGERPIPRIVISAPQEAAHTVETTKQDACSLVTGPAPSRDVDDELCRTLLTTKGGKTTRRSLKKIQKEMLKKTAQESRSEVTFDKLGMGKSVLRNVGIEDGQEYDDLSGFYDDDSIEKNDNFKREAVVDKKRVMAENFRLVKGEMREYDNKFLERSARKRGLKLSKDVDEPADAEIEAQRNVLSSKLTQLQQTMSADDLAAMVAEAIKESKEIEPTALAIVKKSEPVLMSFGTDFAGWDATAWKPKTLEEELQEMEDDMRAAARATAKVKAVPAEASPMGGHKRGVRGRGRARNKTLSSMEEAEESPEIEQKDTNFNVNEAEFPVIGKEVYVPKADALVLATPADGTSWSKIAASGVAPINGKVELYPILEPFPAPADAPVSVAVKEALLAPSPTPKALKGPLEYMVCFINVPQTTSLRPIAESVSSELFGPLVGIFFDFSADSTRWVIVQFQHAKQAENYYRAMVRQQATEPYWRTASLWPFSAADSESIKVELKIIPAEDASRAYRQMSRRLTLVNSFQMHKTVMEPHLAALCVQAGVGKHRIQKIVVNNFGNATIAVASCVEANLIRKHLLKEYRQKGLHVQYSSDPCDKKLGWKRDENYIKHVESKKGLGEAGLGEWE